MQAREEGGREGHRETEKKRGKGRNKMQESQHKELNLELYWKKEKKTLTHFLLCKNGFSKNWSLMAE